jgi:microcompartment protein CcmL/EutN
MSDGKALGFIETAGLAAAIAAADAALKAANVKLVGRENSKGQGCITVKISGDVGAVKAAVDAAQAAVDGVLNVSLRAVTVIPRPAEGIGDLMAWNGETTLDFRKTDREAKPPSDNREEPKEERQEEQKEEQKFEEQNAQAVQEDVQKDEPVHETEQEIEQEIEQEAEQEPEENEPAEPEKQRDESRPKPGRRGKNPKKRG